MLTVGRGTIVQCAMWNGLGMNAPTACARTGCVAHPVTMPTHTARREVATTTGWVLTAVSVPHIFLGPTLTVPIAYPHTLAKSATNLVPVAHMVLQTRPDQAVPATAPAVKQGGLGMTARNVMVNISGSTASHVPAAKAGIRASQGFTVMDTALVVLRTGLGTTATIATHPTLARIATLCAHAACTEQETRLVSLVQGIALPAQITTVAQTARFAMALQTQTIARLNTLESATTQLLGSRYHLGAHSCATHVVRSRIHHLPDPHHQHHRHPLDPRLQHLAAIQPL